MSLDSRHTPIRAMLPPNRALARSIARVWLTLVLVAGLASCDRKSEPPRPDAKPTARNVVLIIVDTLRADKLGCYGSTLGLTPNIDRFAAEGFRFDFAFSHAPWTLPATASLLTSAYPQQHGAGGKDGNTGRFTGINDSVRTMAQCFRSQGYDTAAIVNVVFLAPTFGLNRGFDEYNFKKQDETQTKDRRATEVTDWAVAWMKKHRETSKRPFFLLVHYFDPHLKYDPPAKFREKYAMPQDKTPDPTLFGSEKDMMKFRSGGIDVHTIPIKRLEALYNGEVAYTDEQVGRLLDEMKKMSLDQSTVVALTADHGEEFLDHDGFEHGHTLYDEMIHIPLMVRSVPNLKPGFSVQNVGHIDVAPTLCSLADVDPEPTFQGRNLETLMRDSRIEPGPIFSQGNMWGAMLRAFRDDGYKLIKGAVTRELFNVNGDPRETKNLCAEERFTKKCDEYETRMEDFGKKIGTKPGVKVVLSDEEEDRVLIGGYSSGKKSDTKNPDAAVGVKTTSQPSMPPPSTQPADRSKP